MSLQERFDEKWTPEPFSGCWLWTAAIDSKGYGHFYLLGVNAHAHRVSWELYRGAIPEGMHVLHRCDTPGCVNPDHLYLGTNRENMRDKVERGGQPTGESHCRAKLTEEQVRFIRSSPLRNIELARKLGMRDSTICMIRKRKTWRKVH